MAPISGTSDEESDDEFPDLATLVAQAQAKPLSPERRRDTVQDPPSLTPPVQSPAKRQAVRRRKLGQLPENMLLKPWTPDEVGTAPKDNDPPFTTDSMRPSKPAMRASRPRVQLRTRKNSTTIVVTPVNYDNRLEGDVDSPAEEISIADGASVDDSSDFQDTFSLDSDEDESMDDTSTFARSPVWRPRELRSTGATSHSAAHPRILNRNTKQPAPRVRGGKDTVGRDMTTPCPPDDELAGVLSCLRIIEPRQISNTARSDSNESSIPRSSTPPTQRPSDSLVSPAKLPRIPATPHHPRSDLFWSKEFVDDWNDTHSPKKPILPSSTRSSMKPEVSPTKKAMSKKMATRKDAKKAFESTKHEMARGFLQELDKVITEGRLAELAESSGGIKINWTNKLNTTAGRANWKRETVRTKNQDGSDVSVQQRHHASIELAEKVIDDEHRLRNVIAHEFCHLANFMVSGVTGNPHGKEFKGWAARCSRAFGDRGIEVTTKHSYDIDFKYIWECSGCGLEYKRHSKSINPERHRCGGCKSELKQTKPVPRAGAGKPTEYQMFMKEQMKLLKDERPKSPQKEIMKLVADVWSSRQALTKVEAKAGQAPTSDNEVAGRIAGLTLDD